MKRVIIESPYAGDVAVNTAYAQACLLDSLRRGEAPLASHLLYTQVLDDTIKDDRELGITAGIAWGEVADLVAVYTDRGVSPGMKFGIAMHQDRGLTIEYRMLSVPDPLPCPRCGEPCASVEATGPHWVDDPEQSPWSATVQKVRARKVEGIVTHADGEQCFVLDVTPLLRSVFQSK